MPCVGHELFDARCLLLCAFLLLLGNAADVLHCVWCGHVVSREIAENDCHNFVVVHGWKFGGIDTTDTSNETL